MSDTGDTIMGNIVLYSTSSHKKRVDLSDQMKCIPPETALSLLSIHKKLLERDLKNYDNPKYLKRSSVRSTEKLHEPPKEYIEGHLEVTNSLISKFKVCLLNG